MKFLNGRERLEYLAYHVEDAVRLCRGLGFDGRYVQDAGTTAHAGKDWQDGAVHVRELESDYPGHRGHGKSNARVMLEQGCCVLEANV